MKERYYVGQKLVQVKRGNIGEDAWENITENDRTVTITNLFEVGLTKKFDTGENGTFDFEYADKVFIVKEKEVKEVETISIEGYKFIYPEDVTGLVLHMVRDNRIVGSYINNWGNITPITFDLKGDWQMVGGHSKDSFNLTLYDKFKDLKRAYKEGALIENYCRINNKWRLSQVDALWSDEDEYRIKDGIPIIRWDAHKEFIKAYWDGAKIEFLSSTNVVEWRDTINKPMWFPNDTYRVKENIEMTIEELEKKLGIKNLKIVKEK